MEEQKLREGKTCFKCKTYKDMSNFSRNRAMSDGFSYICKKCDAQYKREKKKKNPETTRLRQKRFYYKNHEYIKAKHAKFAKEKRRKNPEETRKKDKEKHQKYKFMEITHSKVNWAVKSGKLKRPDNCSRCGKEGKIQGHHPDYSKPLEVIWVCIACHMAIHHPDAIQEILK